MTENEVLRERAHDADLELANHGGVWLRDSAPDAKKKAERGDARPPERASEPQ